MKTFTKHHIDTSPIGIIIVHLHVENLSTSKGRNLHPHQNINNPGLKPISPGLPHPHLNDPGPVPWVPRSTKRWLVSGPKYCSKYPLVPNPPPTPITPPSPTPNPPNTYNELRRRHRYWFTYRNKEGRFQNGRFRPHQIPNSSPQSTIRSNQRRRMYRYWILRDLLRALY